MTPHQVVPQGSVLGTTIHKWISQYFLQLNTNKTEILIIAPDGVKCRLPIDLVYYLTVIHHGRKLGDIFDCSCSLDRHIKLVQVSFYVPP